MSPYQNIQQTCLRFMPDSTQGFKEKKNEGTLKETKFPQPTPLSPLIFCEDGRKLNKPHGIITEQPLRAKDA